MKILYIDHYAGASIYGMEYRPYFLAKEWIGMGHEVTIVAASFSHLRFSQPDATKLKNYEIIDNIHYFWIKTCKYKGNSIKRIINIITFLTKLLFVLQKLNNRPFDLVISSSTYVFDSLIENHFVRKWKAKLFFEVKDIWPLTLIELGNISKNNLFVILMKYAEKYAYFHADKIITVLPGAFLHIERLGVSKEKVFCIPNGIDISYWENTIGGSQNTSKKISEWKKNRFAVGYAGTLGVANSLENLILAAKSLSDIAFIFVGNGSQKKSLIKMADGIKNILFVDTVNRDEIPQVLGEMDCLYLGWKRSPLYKYGISPNKLADYMMSGKPIIHAVEAYNNPVSEAGCGISIPPENVEALKSAIKSIQSLSKSEREDLGDKGKCYAKNNLAYSELAKRYINVYRELDLQV